MKNMTKTAVSLLLAVSLATPAMAQTVVFNGQHNDKTGAVKIDGRFFLTVDDLNILFREVEGLDVNNYTMFFETLEPAAITIDGQVFVPVRAFSEAMGWEVDWVVNQVIINFPEEFVWWDDWVEGQTPVDIIDETHYHTFEDINLDDLLLPSPELPAVDSTSDFVPWWLTQPEPEVLANPGIMGALHRVTHGENVAYIFGSFHAGLGHWFPMADAVEAAMAGADVFAFEADIFTPSDEEVARFLEILEELSFLPDGQTWVDVLPAEVYHDFVNMVEALGIVYDEDIHHANPLILMNAITTEILIPMLGLEWYHSVDAYVNSVAQQLERPVIGLQTIYSELLKIFDVPLEVMIDQTASFSNVDLAIETLEQEMQIMEDMVTAYETGDLDALRTIIAYAMSLYTAETPHQIHTRDVVNFARSIQFGEAIAALLQETDAPTTFFVTVGISHVIRGGLGLEEDGITNIINYLQNVGFEVEALH